MFTVRSSPVSLRAPGASVGGRGQCQCVIRCHQATREACERRLKGREVIQKIKLTLCKVNLKTTRTNEYCCILLGVLKNLMISCKTSYILYLPQPDAAWNTQFILKLHLYFFQASSAMTLLRHWPVKQCLGVRTFGHGRYDWRPSQTMLTGCRDNYPMCTRFNQLGVIPRRLLAEGTIRSVLMRSMVRPTAT